MKRFIYFLVLLPFLAIVSCDKDTQPDITRDLSVTSDKTLYFEPGGGTLSFTVTAENVDWAMKSDDAWITCEMAQNSENIVNVTVGEYDDTEAGREGKITVYATNVENVEDVIVTVIQSKAAPVIKTLSVDPETLTFDVNGGTLSFTVTAENVEWDLRSDDEWISYQTGQEARNEITVVTGIYVGTEQRSGSIVIYAVGEEDADVDDVLLSVVQTGIDPFIWNRPSSQRMNYYGKVKSVEYHEYIPRDGEITNLSFGEGGMLLSFNYEKFNGSVVDISLEYDNDNRLVEIKGGGSEDYAMVLEYGAHGKYIPTEEVFNELSVGQVTNNLLWFPLLVRDLVKITYTDEKSPSKNMTFTYRISGDTGSMDMIDSRDEIQDFHVFTFENEYVKTIIYPSWGQYITGTYTIDGMNGCVLKNHQVDNWGEVILEFNNDRLNTLSKVLSDWGNDEYEYNTNLDLAKTISDGTVDKTVTYEYDAYGNWITRTIDSDVITREIVYW